MRARTSARDLRRLARASGRVAREIDRAANGGGSRRPDAAARRVRTLLAVAVFIVLMAVVALDRTGAFSTAPGDVASLDGAAVRVERVIDGDTLVLATTDRTTGKAIRVRLWGVDAPELAHGGSAAEPLAGEARAALERFVGAGEVTLALERSETRDRYGRLLAHVIVDGESAGAALVAAGLAESVERWRHRDTERFEALELAARRAKRGIWSESTP